MRMSERSSLKNLYGDKHCIEASTGIIEDDRVKINEGALIGKEHVIKKINRHRREAVIEVCLMGSLREIIVGLEIVEKV